MLLFLLKEIIPLILYPNLIFLIPLLYRKKLAQ
jgi:hypothetical protein